MQTEPPVTLKQTNNIIRRIIICIVLFILIFSPKQDVQASNKSESEEILLVQQELPMEYTEKELILLATVIYAEAGICNDEEKYRVGNVVINRLNDIKHNEFVKVDTLEKVIYQQGQFTCVGGKAWKQGPTEIEKEIAKELLEGKRVLPENVVWFSKKHNYGEKHYESKWHVFSGWEQNEEGE